MSDEVASEFLARGEADTRRLGECLAAAVAPGPAGGAARRRAAVIAIEGELGAGKTRLVRGIAGGLGADAGAVASPTFVLCVEHAAADGVRLAHLDAWRIRGEEDLATIGFEELLADPRAVLAIEWASRIAPALPTERIEVRIDHETDDSGAEVRRIHVVDRRPDPAERERLRRALALFEPTAGGPRSSACPVCRSPVAADAATFPFCTSRCRMADLQRWFGGRYTISRPAESDDELSD